MVSCWSRSGGQHDGIERVYVGLEGSSSHRSSVEARLNRAHPISGLQEEVESPFAICKTRHNAVTQISNLALLTTGCASKWVSGQVRSFFRFGIWLVHLVNVGLFFFLLLVSDNFCAKVSDEGAIGIYRHDISNATQWVVFIIGPNLPGLYIRISKYSRSISKSAHPIWIIMPVDLDESII